MLTLDAEPSEHVVFGGATSVPLGRLLCQESAEKRFTVVFLAQGQFTLSAKARSTVGTLAEVTGGDCEMKVGVRDSAV